MITIETLCLRVQGLTPTDVEIWVRNQWVRPAGEPGHYLFADMDIARAQLILELREEMGINDDALPVVLSLVDQLYAERRRMRRLREILDSAAPQDLRELIFQSWRTESKSN